MTTRNLWLCAAAVLALAACDRIQGAARKPTQAVQAAAAPGAAAAKSAPGEAASAPPDTQGAATSDKPAVAAIRKPATSLTASKAVRKPAAVARPGSYAAKSGAVSGETGSRGESALQEAGYSADYQACVVRANGFTVARADCQSAELARQGQRLSQVYATAAANRSGVRRERLEATQRDWASERDASCRAEAGRGDADLLQEGSCRLDMTIRRANGLISEAG